MPRPLLSVLPRVTRQTIEPPGMWAGVSSCRLRRMILNALGRSAGCEFRREGISVNDYFFGLLSDTDLNFYQTYDLYRIAGGSRSTIVSGATVAPVDVGDGSMPNYVADLMTPERKQALTAGGGEYGDGTVYKEVVRQMGRDGWLFHAARLALTTGWCFQRRWSQKYCSGARRTSRSSAAV